MLGADDDAERNAGETRVRREAEALGVPVHLYQRACEAILDGALPANFRRRPDASEDCGGGRYAFCLLGRCPPTCCNPPAGTRLRRGRLSFSYVSRNVSSPAAKHSIEVAAIMMVCGVAEARQSVHSGEAELEQATQEWSLAAPSPPRGDLSTPGLQWVEPPLPRSNCGASPHSRTFYGSFMKVIGSCPASMLL